MWIRYVIAVDGGRTYVVLDDHPGDRPESQDAARSAALDLLADGPPLLLRQVTGHVRTAVNRTAIIDIQWEVLLHQPDHREPRWTFLGPAGQ